MECSRIDGCFVGLFYAGCDMMDKIKELYFYREMIINLVRKDLRTRYKGSILGFLWTFVNPLLQLLIYSVVFSYVMRMQMDHYYMFMFVGLIPWMFFCASVQGGATAIVSGADLVKKIYFPRLVLPIAVVSAAFMNMLFSMVVMFAALFYSGLGISLSIVYLSIALLIIYMIGLGLAFFFSAINVYFRDMEHILGIVTMSLFYATPIIYPVSMVPERLLGWFRFNPMFSVICTFHDILYYQRPPDMGLLLNDLTIAVVILVVGSVVFFKLEKNFVEEL